MTPLQLKLLLHYHSSPHDHAMIFVDEWRDQAEEVRYMGLLELGGEAAIYRITEKGRFHVGRLCDHPLPVSVVRWEYPGEKP